MPTSIPKFVAIVGPGHSSTSNGIVIGVLDQDSPADAVPIEAGPSVAAPGAVLPVAPRGIRRPREQVAAAPAQAAAETLRTDLPRPRRPDPRLMGMVGIGAGTAMLAGGATSIAAGFIDSGTRGHVNDNDYLLVGVGTGLAGNGLVAVGTGLMLRYTSFFSRTAGPAPTAPAMGPPVPLLPFGEPVPMMQAEVGVDYASTRNIPAAPSAPIVPDEPGAAGNPAARADDNV